MALSTAGDYQAALNELLYYFDQNFGGFDRYGIAAFTHISPEDLQTIWTAYYQAKQTRTGQAGLGIQRVVANSGNPSLVVNATNKVVYENGGGENKATSPVTW